MCCTDRTVDSRNTDHNDPVGEENKKDSSANPISDHTCICVDRLSIAGTNITQTFNRHTNTPRTQGPHPLQFVCNDVAEPRSVEHPNIKTFRSEDFSAVS